MSLYNYGERVIDYVVHPLLVIRISSKLGVKTVKVLLGEGNYNTIQLYRRLYYDTIIAIIIVVICTIILSEV